jgi:hypothetical protein
MPNTDQGLVFPKNCMHKPLAAPTLATHVGPDMEKFWGLDRHKAPNFLQGMGSSAQRATTRGSGPSGNWAAFFF